MLIMRGPGGFTGGKVFDAMVSHLDIYPTLCEHRRGRSRPTSSRAPRCCRSSRDETDRIHDEIFTEVTYHAAYEPTAGDPHRALEVHPPLRRQPASGARQRDDSASKELLVEAGWADQIVDTEQLYDLILDPNEVRNLAEEPGHANVVEELRERLDHLDEGDRRPAARRADSGATRGRRQRTEPGLPKRPAADGHAGLAPATRYR